MNEYTVIPGDGQVRFFGRTDSRVFDGLTFFDWSCSGFEFEFFGTASAVRIFTGKWREGKPADPGNRAFLGVWLDEAAEKSSVIEIDEEEKLITLAEDLPKGRHRIKVIKLTEAGYGRAALKSILTDGSKPAATVPKKRRLEFIGDSITCGYGNICPDASPVFKTDEEDASLTYAFLLAEKLDAEISCVCASGNGVFHDYGMNTVNLIPELYRYTDKMLSGHYGKQPDEWDFASYVPDLIVIKLGANDARYCMGMDLDESDRTDQLINEREEQFRKKYVDFLKQVRDSNPSSGILVFYDSDTHLRGRIGEAVAEYKKYSGDGNIRLTCVLSKQPDEGVGANGHWAVATHKRVAQDLYDFISKT